MCGKTIKHEKSCGAVIFREETSGQRHDVLYLIEEMQKGHFSLCKGHVEKNETEHQTAVREIGEETGLTVSFLNGFRETVSYAPAPGIRKEVVFFLAKRTGGVERAQPEEVRSIRWLPFDDACALLTYESDREILKKADAFRRRPEKDSFVKQAERVLFDSVSAVMPYESVCGALKDLPEIDGAGKLYVVSIGKAAWEMARAAETTLGDKIYKGFVLTKYGHARGQLGHFVIREAGHPVPDANTFSATEEILQMTSGLHDADRVLFLVSGGGSALFESPAITVEEYISVTESLLRSGASIDEFNAVRKHLSRVKGGRFALHCAPASIFALLLSDVVGDRPDVIASGPVSPDGSTSKDALDVLERYGIPVSAEAVRVLRTETPKRLERVGCRIIGSVRRLCAAAEESLKSLGYEPVLLTDSLNQRVEDAVNMFVSAALKHSGGKKAYIAGGEALAEVRGQGLGGRCQEAAVRFAMSECVQGRKDVFFFAFGSDGTDGPTDAAGGFSDGRTVEKMKKAGLDPEAVLLNSDSYHALESVGQLLITGPTGTNVNDLMILLCAG